MARYPLDECYKTIDADKGLLIRSRWVAKQFRGSGPEEWFAATPPLEVLRIIISNTVAGSKDRAPTIDGVVRAFFYAAVQHNVYVKLREES